jgi:aminoglycoside phosphotransferase (APT) family kinase protein
MNHSIQFSVTRIGGFYKIIAQDRKEILRSYLSDDVGILSDLKAELKVLEQVNEADLPSR